MIRLRPTPRPGKRFAVLARDESGQLLEVFLQQRSEAEHQAGAIDDRRCDPCRQCGRGGFNDVASFLGRRKRYAGDDFAGGRVEDIAGALGFEFCPIATRENWNGFLGWCGCSCHKCLM